jgi:hypothetical protein
MLLHDKGRPFMEGEGTWMYHLSKRFSWVFIPLVVLLMVSILWNLHQSWLIADARQQAKRALSNKAARVREEAQRAEALKKKNAKWAASDARLQELYREIDTLSRLNDRVLSQPASRLKKASIVDNPAETLSTP